MDGSIRSDHEIRPENTTASRGRRLEHRRAVGRLNHLPAAEPRLAERPSDRREHVDNERGGARRRRRSGRARGPGGLLRSAPELVRLPGRPGRPPVRHRRRTRGLQRPVRADRPDRPQAPARLRRRGRARKPVPQSGRPRRARHLHGRGRGEHLHPRDARRLRHHRFRSARHGRVGGSDLLESRGARAGARRRAGRLPERAAGRRGRDSGDRPRRCADRRAGGPSRRRRRR